MRRMRRMRIISSARERRKMKKCWKEEDKKGEKYR